MSPSADARLLAFGDDSADGAGDRVFCVAAVLGSPDEWRAVDAEWSKLLGSRIFHAADCESDRKAFKTFPHEENQRLYRQLVRVLAGSRLLSYAHIIDLQAVARVFDDGMPPWDSSFYFCFTRVIADCARTAYVSLEQAPVKFTFDERKESKYNATKVYEHAAMMRDWKFSGFLADRLEFASRSTIGIQVADLIARESMKEATRQIDERKDIRESLRAIADSKRFKGRIYGESYIRGMREGVAKLDHPHNIADYAAWLVETGQADNISSRVQWLLHADLKAGLLKSADDEDDGR